MTRFLNDELTLFLSKILGIFKILNMAVLSLKAFALCMFCVLGLRAENFVSTQKSSTEPGNLHFLGVHDGNKSVFMWLPLDEVTSRENIIAPRVRMHDDVIFQYRLIPSNQSQANNNNQTVKFAVNSVLNFVMLREARTEEGSELCIKIPEVSAKETCHIVKDALPLNLPKTTNITITSRNLNLSVAWQYVIYESVTIREIDFEVALFNVAFDEWEVPPGCERLHQLQCNLFQAFHSPFNDYCPSYSNDGEVRVRVRPCSRLEPSACGAWVEHKPLFLLPRDDVIEPPVFSILGVFDENQLRIMNKPHTVANKSLNCYYDKSLKYLIRYWSRDDKSQAMRERVATFDRTLITLPLREKVSRNTTMCVRMRIEDDLMNSFSEWREVCKDGVPEKSGTTDPTKKSRPGIIIILVVSLSVCTALLGVAFYKAKKFYESIHRQHVKIFNEMTSMLKEFEKDRSCRDVIDSKYDIDINCEESLENITCFTAGDVNTKLDGRAETNSEVSKDEVGSDVAVTSFSVGLYSHGHRGSMTSQSTIPQPPDPLMYIRHTGPDDVIVNNNVVYNESATTGLSISHLAFPSNSSLQYSDFCKIAWNRGGVVATNPSPEVQSVSRQQGRGTRSLSHRSTHPYTTRVMSKRSVSDCTLQSFVHKKENPKRSLSEDFRGISAPTLPEQQDGDTKNEVVYAAIQDQISTTSAPHIIGHPSSERLDIAVSTDGGPCPLNSRSDVVCHDSSSDEVFHPEVDLPCTEASNQLGIREVKNPTYNFDKQTKISVSSDVDQEANAASYCDWNDTVSSIPSKQPSLYTSRASRQKRSSVYRKRLMRRRRAHSCTCQTASNIYNTTNRHRSQQHRRAYVQSNYCDRACALAEGCTRRQYCRPGTSNLFQSSKVAYNRTRSDSCKSADSGFPLDWSSFSDESLSPPLSPADFFLSNIRFSQDGRPNFDSPYTSSMTGQSPVATSSTLAGISEYPPCDSRDLKSHFTFDGILDLSVTKEREPTVDIIDGMANGEEGNNTDDGINASYLKISSLNKFQFKLHDTSKISTAYQ